MTSIRTIQQDDFEEWSVLWSGYLRFYESEIADDVTRATFGRLVKDRELHGALAIDEEGHAIGLVHWLTHAATWSTGEYCYLEDLFVAPDARGSGSGRAMIAHVREWAEQGGCAKLYWLTQEGNATARALYDRVATNTGFTHYQISL
ncbi:GNAT family N-acetyltransferase [Microbacterium sp. LTA6]|uniref:GNAT family N-acetyltransferase n=1 Tax=Microbacterium sp. LTA6 TaxID=3129771 RepID=UPI003251BC34